MMRLMVSRDKERQWGVEGVWRQGRVGHQGRDGVCGKSGNNRRNSSRNPGKFCAKDHSSAFCGVTKLGFYTGRILVCPSGAVRLAAVLSKTVPKKAHTTEPLNEAQ